jgi:hypothetical protein
MKKNIFITLLTIMLITGCVASHQVIPLDFKTVKLPEINIITTASLGDRMLESGKFASVDGFNLSNDVAIFDGVIKAGEYHQIGVKENHKVFSPKNGYGTGIVDFMGNKSPAKVYIDSSTGLLCFLGGFGTRFCSDQVKPNIVKINTYTVDSFSQELIYTGKVGDKIRFTYREYKNGIARQAFNVDVEYDLSVDNLISYKGATIEVIAATNRKIEYQVLKHFN